MANRREVLGAIGGAVALALRPHRARAAFGQYARGAAAGATPATFDYYISTTATPANDGTTNTGSLSAPWSLNALNTQGATYTGKRVGLLPGTYACLSIYTTANGGSTLGSTSTTSVNPPAFIVANGSSGSPTYIGSSDSSGYYSARAAILDGGATSQTQSQTINPGQNALIGALGDGGKPNAAYITLDGLAFQNNFSAMVYFGANAGVTPSARATGVTIKNCHFSGTLYNVSGGAYASNNPSFLTLWACQDALIQNNLFDGIFDDAQNRATVFEQWACLGTITEYNTIVMNGGSTSGNGAMFAKNINNTQLMYRYNYCYIPNNTSGLGNGWDLYGDSSVSSYFHNNVIVANNDAWYSVGGGLNNALYAEQKYVYNNTFASTGSSWSSEGFLQLGAANSLQAYNNIIAAGAGYLGGYGGNSDEFTLSDYNLFPSTPSLCLCPPGNDATSPTIYSSISSWAAALPSGCIGKDAHSVLGAPTFVGGSPTYPANSYQLAAGSLGIGTGSSNGQTSGTAVDMGAWGGTDVNTGLPIAQIGCNFT